MSITIVRGVTPNGNVVTLRLNEDGSIAIQGIGNSDSTAANQQTQIQQLSEIRDRLDSIKIYTDGLEALLTNSNTVASSIANYVDGLEGYTDQLEGFVQAVRDRVATDATLVEVRDRVANSSNQAEELMRLGAINEAAASTDSSPSGLNGLLRRILSRLPLSGRTSTSQSISVALANDHPSLTSITSPDYFSTPVSATANTNSFLFAPSEVGKYRSCCLHLYGVPNSAAVVFEGSNDSSNWVNLKIESFGGESTTINAINTSGQYYCLLKFRYFRIRVSVGFGGNISGSVYFSSSFLPLESAPVKVSVPAPSVASRTTENLSTSSSLILDFAVRSCLILTNLDQNNSLYVSIGKTASNANSFSFILSPQEEKTLSKELASQAFTAATSKGNSSIAIVQII